MSDSISAAPGPPPPPPPPPSPANTFKSANIPINNHTSAPSVELSENECAWAAEHPELMFACRRFRICLSHEPFKYRYRYFSSILQDGPTCGLIAMTILLDDRSKVPTLLRMAQDRCFSRVGELFSARDACRLLSEATRDENLNYKIEHKIGNLFDADVIDKLLDGWFLLVPYDSDNNHSPCLKRGHKAHWAVVTGIVITEEPSRAVFHPDTVYVTAKQGKSAHLGLWKLQDLAASNQNLDEESPKRQDCVIPSGGIGGPNGLKGQYILIQP